MRPMNPDQRRQVVDSVRTRATPGKPSRRQILQGGLALGAGLVVGFQLPRPARAAVAEAAEAATDFVPNAFLRIAPDGTITVLSKHIEFGQGTYTGLATMVAEELDADWKQVRVVSAPAEVPTYANSAFGIQGTGGSTAMANSWTQMRQAGATARAMLVAAAAEEWGVDPAQIHVEKGIVHHRASSRSATFGELANAASKQTPPEKPQLKDPKDFRLIGKRKLPRVDVPAKSNGTARFTLDQRQDGMLTAVVARSPRFGGQVSSFDASAAQKVNGVVKVLQIPTGVAVVAKNFWAAKKGRDALTVEWDDSQAEMRGSDELFADFQALLKDPGLEARKVGDVETALAGAATTLEATYYTPYLAHAAMEPLDCVIHHQGDRCQVWAGSQLQTVDQGTVAHILGLEPQNVSITTELTGGSFGRRATPDADIAAEAALLAKAYGEAVPLRTVWTREDDLRGGKYRPLFAHRLRAGLDANGKIVAWDQRLAGQSFLAGTPFEGLIQNGIDATSVEGARGLPYAVPNLRVGLHSPKAGITGLWWRSVGHTHNAFTTETFLDDLAREAGRDPVELRLELLGDRHPRLRKVLEAAADRAGWGRALPDGVARGVALHESFGSFVAQVVEIRRGKRGLPRVERVVCAIDCGIPLNPDNIAAQMEGGIGYGLGAALYNEVVIEKGIPQPTNFNNYRSLRIHEMPRVEVHVVPSGEDPTGVGEPGVPPIAPAVANAWKVLTGHSVRRLPFIHPSNRQTA